MEWPSDNKFVEGFFLSARRVPENWLASFIAVSLRRNEKLRFIENSITSEFGMNALKSLRESSLKMGYLHDSQSIPFLRRT